MTPQDREASGPYSRMLAAAGTFGGTVGSAFPVLSSIMGPTEWFLRAAAKAVSSFGYSKPVEPTRPMRTLNALTTYQHNSDGFETAINLGLTADTRVGLMKLAGMDADEMTVDFLKRYHTRIDMFSYAKTTGRDTVLWTIDQSVNQLYDRESNAAYRACSMPLYLANMAWYWRGDLTFTFTAVRTIFHSGKLLIGFIPYNEENDTTPGVADAMDYHSVVWDLSSASTVEFTVPFTSSSAWSTFSRDNGQIFVSVISPLVCPANVAQSVPITVTVGCADNFAVAGVRSLHSPVTYYGDDPLAEEPRDSESFFDVAQADLPYATLSSADAELYCIGNAFRSLKQVLNVAQVIQPVSVTAGDVYKSIDCNWIATASRAKVGSSYNSHAAIMGLYSLYRGSWGLTATVPLGEVVEATWASTGRVRARDILTVSVPYYSETTRSLFIGGKAVTLFAKATPLLEANAGDDFQAGYFVHLPWVKV